MAGSAIAGGQQPALARATNILVRYTSRANGYSLLLPSGWVRVPGVRWTPAGPPADLTLMTPDRQAALGIMVTSTGRTTYSQAERQSIAVRLLYQEDGILPSTTITTKALTVNGVSYDTAFAYLTSGLPDMSTFISVAVTQRNLRLFAVVALVYIQLYTLPQGGPPHRLYSAMEIALMVSSTNATPVLYPYFDPFTAFARLSDRHRYAPPGSGSGAADDTEPGRRSPHRRAVMATPSPHTGS